VVITYRETLLGHVGRLMSFSCLSSNSRNLLTQPGATSSLPSYVRPLTQGYVNTLSSFRLYCVLITTINVTEFPAVTKLAWSHCLLDIMRMCKESGWSATVPHPTLWYIYSHWSTKLTTRHDSGISLWPKSTRG